MVSAGQNPARLVTGDEGKVRGNDEGPETNL